MSVPVLAVIEAVDSATADIPPKSVSVHLKLTRDEFFSGNGAFTQAGELRKLAEALERRGIPKTALSLVGATVDVSSGCSPRRPLSPIAGDTCLSGDRRLVFTARTTMRGSTPVRGARFFS